MKYTKHIKEKMSQRGINRRLLDTVLIYGIVKQDKIILNRKRCKRILNQIDNYNRKLRRVRNSIHIKNLNSSRSIILKILDKGGITLGNCWRDSITTYKHKL